MYLRGEVQLLTGGKAREPSKIGGLGETPGPTVRVWMGEDAITLDPVSYTHLDVYKRQIKRRLHEMNRLRLSASVLIFILVFLIVVVSGYTLPYEKVTAGIGAQREMCIRDRIACDIIQFPCTLNTL